MNGIEAGGASEEEIAEAEKFNAMVKEGMITPSEMAEVEKDKTPEDVEIEKLVMEKVQDINDKGVAYSTITSETEESSRKTPGFNDLYLKKVASILKNGLLGKKFRQLSEGLDLPPEPRDGRKHSPEAWAKEVREGKSFVAFNITHGDNPRGLFEIKNSYYQRYHHGVSIIFDMAHLEEGSPIDSHILHTDFKPKQSQYYPDRPYIDGVVDSSDEYGYVKPGRIAPRLFRGIVVDFVEANSTQEEIDEMVNSSLADPLISYEDLNDEKKEAVRNESKKLYKQRAKYLADETFDSFLKRAGSYRPKKGEDIRFLYAHGKYKMAERRAIKELSICLPRARDFAKLDARIAEIVTIQKEVFAGRTDLMVPIYDVWGNLHWPKKMAYEQVQEFVAKRKTKKEETEKNANN